VSPGTGSQQFISLKLTTLLRKTSAVDGAGATNDIEQSLIAHCDVKPENILLTRDFEVKIAGYWSNKTVRVRLLCLSLFAYAYMKGTAVT
jgi:serine/threonine protein kinase